MNSSTETSQYGLYVPTTNVYDVEMIEKLKVDTPEFSEFLVRLRQSTNNISLALNQKETGLYDLTQFATGQQWFPNPQNQGEYSQYRPVTRLVINFGALPNATTTSVAHGITFNKFFTLTRMYGSSSNATSGEYIPLPYVSTTSINNNVELWLDQTNVNIRTAANYSSYTTTYVIIELLKQ